MVKTLGNLAQMGRELEIAEILEREAAYLEAHREQLDYEAMAQRGEQLGATGSRRTRWRCG